jgi:hypothetical protein
LEFETPSVTEIELVITEDEKSELISSAVYDKYAETITKEILESIKSEQPKMTDVVPEEEIEEAEMPFEITTEVEEETPQVETTEKYLVAVLTQIFHLL